MDKDNVSLNKNLQKYDLSSPIWRVISISQGLQDQNEGKNTDYTVIHLSETTEKTN